MKILNLIAVLLCLIILAVGLYQHADSGYLLGWLCALTSNITLFNLRMKYE